MKLLLDMNLSPAWLAVLAAHGHDAVHWSEVGAADAPDTHIMAWAVSDGRVIITHNLDLTTLLALTGANGPSVVQLQTQDILPDTASDLLLRVLREFTEQLNAGAIVTVEEDRRRVRILPLSR